MSTHESPSPLLGTFVRWAQRLFPPDQQALVDRYAGMISKTTADKDPERARRCALWAIEQAADRNQAHPRWQEIKELHEVWKDAWFGTEFGLMGAAGKHEPREDVRIRWVQDAVEVATKLGEEDGWDKSPWEPLLQELINMEAPKS